MTQQKKTSRLPGISPGRRKFLSDTVKTACSVGVLGLGIGIYSRQSSALPALAIRPPGAIAEEDFLSACTRCGLCVRDCPYDILQLAKLGEEVATGTPYFTARTGPCEMCEDIPCVPACPTGALDHALTEIKNARMGLAVVVDQEACKGCKVCEKRCQMEAVSVIDKTAFIDETRCIGCGICVPTCKSEAMRLIQKKDIQEPPKDGARLYLDIMKKKAGRAKYTIMLTKQLLGQLI